MDDKKAVVDLSHVDELELEIPAELDDEEHGVRNALAHRISSEFDSGAIDYETLAVYEMELNYGGVTVGVLATSEREAENTARQFVEQQKERAMEAVGHSDDTARTLLQDLRTDVTSQGQANRSTYEVDRNAHWCEGEL